MESYKCKFCFKSFVNERALDGHVRSHMPTLPNFCIEEEEEKVRPSQLSGDTESDVSSSSLKKHRTMDDDQKFAFTGSQRNIINLTRKRSKRTRKLDSFATKKMKTSQLASDTTTDEDLALCLMMLSRDKWKKKNKTSSSHKELVEEIDDNSSKMNRATTTKGRFTCETCGKMFKSYQALGGHRASHKKNRVSSKTEQRSETEYDNVVVAPEKRIHECPICLRVFASGQALGGHKRSHGLGNLSVNHHQVHRTESVKQRMLDLNFPAPTEEDKR
ncbi:hypothetical protein Bca52824_047630 [Brassica carinata]|uniref:C2H2-type domain-containing protein n=1 Tax=Brassica carinata TaxID=52824 RepID=A0A8X7RGQ7_BRACI|nr:hypothetical protein Bca52824_047630 [Brassica carinata]